MIRSVSFIHRRPGTTRAAFRDYYERQHAPLGASYITGLELYVRNHVLEDRGPHQASGQALPFDVVTEFEYGSQADLEAIQEVMATEAGERIREDERRFMDPASIAYFGAERSTLAGPRPDPGTRPKTIAVLAGGDEPAAALAAEARAAAGALVEAESVEAAALDVAHGGDVLGEPWGEVVLHLWWSEATGATAALDALEARLGDAGRAAALLWIEECGSLDFDYATEYPDR